MSAVFENSEVSIAYVTAQDPGYATLGIYDLSDVHLEHSSFINTTGASWRVGVDVGSSHVTMYATTITNMQVGMNGHNGGIIDVHNYINYYNTGGSTDVTINNPAGTNYNGVAIQTGGSLNLDSAKLVLNQTGQLSGGTSHRFQQCLPPFGSRRDIQYHDFVRARRAVSQRQLRRISHVFQM